MVIVKLMHRKCVLLLFLVNFILIFFLLQTIFFYYTFDFIFQRFFLTTNINSRNWIGFN